jgi:hypothetical protein
MGCLMWRAPTKEAVPVLPATLEGGGGTGTEAQRTPEQQEQKLSCNKQPTAPKNNPKNAGHRFTK